MQSCFLLTSTLEEMWGQRQAPSALHLGEKNQYSLNRSYAGPRVSLGDLKRGDISCRCWFTYREGTRDAPCNGMAYKPKVYPPTGHESPERG